MYVYHYDRDHVFDIAIEAQPDPETAGAFLIGADCTPIKPPLAEGYTAAVYSPTGWTTVDGSHYIDGQWSLVADWRTATFYDKQTRQAQHITQLGVEPPAGWTRKVPGQFDIWNEGKQGWEYSPDLEQQYVQQQLVGFQRIKLSLLKDIQLATQHGMGALAADLQNQVQAVEQQIKQLTNQKV